MYSYIMYVCMHWIGNNIRAVRMDIPTYSGSCILDEYTFILIAASSSGPPFCSIFHLPFEDYSFPVAETSYVITNPPTHIVMPRSSKYTTHKFKKNTPPFCSIHGKNRILQTSPYVHYNSRSIAYSLITVNPGRDLKNRPPFCSITPCKIINTS